LNEQTVSCISDFVLTGYALIALLIVIPAASASAQQIKPAWRAWVWPLAFVSIAVANLGAALHNLFGEAETASWLILHYVLLGLALTLIVLNAVYRMIVQHTALYFAPFIWLGYFSYIMAVLTFGSSRPATFLAFGGLAALVLLSIYSTIFVQEHERASDAVPALIAATLTIFAAILGNFSFSFDWGWLSFNQELVVNIVQLPAFIFFLATANNGYTVKYALQRRQQREDLLIEVES
jgi:hypothetical protein